MSKSFADRKKLAQTINDVRLLFPSLYSEAIIPGEGNAPPTHTGKYSTKVLLSPTIHEADLATLKANLQYVAQNAFGDPDLSSVKNLCLRACDFESDSIEAGTLELMAKRNLKDGRPAVVDGNLVAIPEDRADMFYSGVLAAVRIELWGIQNKYGKTISCTLHSVQYRGEGTPLTGGRMSTNEAVKGFAPIDVQAANDPGGAMDPVADDALASFLS